MKRILLVTSLLVLVCTNIRAEDEQLRYKNLFIRWKPIKGAFGYRVQVNDKKNKEVINRTVEKNEVTMRIPEGTYKLRLGSLNRSKRVENWSDWKTITIVVKDPPGAPEKLVTKKIITGRNTMDIVLSWKAPVKNRKSRLKYIIFDMSSGKAVNVATTTALNHTIKKVKRGRDYTFKVFALNAYGEESEQGVTTIVEDWNIPMALSVTAGYIMPFQKFSDLFDYGFAVNLRYTFNNIFFDDFFLGPEVGYYYLAGNDTFSYDNFAADTSHVVPVSLLAGYTLRLSPAWSLEPALSVGICANMLQYRDFERERSKIFWEPVIKTGLSGSYSTGNNFSFSLGAEYAVIFESDGLMQFFIFSAGARYMIDFI